MFYEAGSRDHLTIAAVCTPPGYGGISVIRISGSESFKIVLKSVKKCTNLESHRAFLAEFLNIQTGKAIDEVIILPFEHGKSFTGEESVEISCHGSPIICSAILQELCRNGCELAINGEFTYRAFLSNRLDLVQAESVLALIHSQSELGSKLALRQLKGELSAQIVSLKENIIWCLAHIEAGIDFSEQNITVVEDHILIQKLESALNDFNLLLDSYETGRVLKDGITLVLSGEPNVGKSSLMNVLLNDERSIVSDIPGTTRDVIREDLLYKNLKFTLVDTAGIRKNSDDPIEKMGVERSIKERKESFFNLVIFDISRPMLASEDLIYKDLNLERTLFILNKCDLLSNTQALEIKKEFENHIAKVFGGKTSVGIWNSVLLTSSKEVSTKKQILNAVYDFWVSKFAHLESVAVSSARQREELRQAHSLLVKVIAGLKSHMGSEFIAFDLKGCLMALQRTLGEVYDDQILDKVFKEFCLGK